MIRTLPNPFHFAALPILAFAVMVLSSVPVRAGCGEPMLTLNHSGPAQPSKPCQGPNCSAAPQEVPAPAPTTDSFNATGDWAVSNVEVPILFVAAVRTPTPVSMIRSVRIATVPFHPPRGR